MVTKAIGNDGDMRFDGQRVWIKRGRLHNRGTLERGEISIVVTDIEDVKLNLGEESGIPTSGTITVIPRGADPNDLRQWQITSPGGHAFRGLSETYLAIMSTLGSRIIPEPPHCLEGLNGILERQEDGIQIMPRESAAGHHPMSARMVPWHDIIDTYLYLATPAPRSILAVITDDMMNQMTSGQDVDVEDHVLGVSLEIWPQTAAFFQQLPRRYDQGPYSFREPDFEDLIAAWTQRRLARDAQGSTTVAHDVGAAPAVPSGQTGYLDELRELAALHGEGFLSDEEFEAQKRRLLPGS